MIPAMTNATQTYPAPAQLHARAENQLSRARAQLSNPQTNYKLVENQLRAALDAVMALGSLNVIELNA